ncbi:hypothetical protein PQS90_20120 [Pseudomonas sp. BLCC-B13]|uniref:hypothetical protein n=1 Tax=Pseudomonas sp. BLCC-B13 TaxID=3025314 RepID=UPI00234F5BD3|nr:hypothetical protein [Pseudomonas sp. BLCC-B13]MDC7827461.1 hypothetical protein [Pseudomonas sp. BLCC-B13]
MKLITLGMAALAAALTSEAWADSEPYYQCGEPKNEIGMVYRTCGSTQNSMQLTTFKYRDPQTGQMYVDRDYVLQTVNCRDGICADVRSKALVEGEVPDGFYRIQRGYQLINQGGVIYAVHPEAIAQFQTQTPAQSKGPELYCSNMSETCTLTINGQGLEVTREELPKHVGFYQGDRSNCIAESCLGSKGEFLGLNPDYYQQ